MCLKKVQFAMSVVDNQLVGEGYKVVQKNLTALVYRNFIYEVGEWQTAGDLKKIPIQGDIYAMSKDGENVYPRGFHIFLNVEDAKEYAKANGGGSIVYKVQFKEILAFGLNEVVYNDKDRKWENGDCVVSLHMKLVEEVDKKPFIDPQLVLDLYRKHGKFPCYGKAKTKNDLAVCPLSILYLDSLNGVMFTDTEAPYKDAKKKFGNDFVNNFWRGFDNAAASHNYPSYNEAYNNGVTVANLLKKFYNIIR
jgi:hypothetical protein